MGEILLSQIPLSELIAEIKKAVSEELNTRQNGANQHDSDHRPMTIEELCDHLRITEPTLLRWRRKGKIPFFYVGSAVRFNLSEVLKALEKK